MERKSEYSKKLLDPRWQKKRLEILNRDEFTCRRCFNENDTLHVHHKIYIFGRDPWDVPSEHLVTLCQQCHQEETDQMPAAISKIAEVLKSKFFSADILTLAEGFEKYCMPHVEDVCASVIAENLADENKAKRMMREAFKDVEIIEKRIPKDENPDF